ncbi:murein hydrolase activator EnvC [Microbacterium sp. EST19A]|uniref:murein hydrolase activator EnvC family protein n=1 Tax=Microbacterium sp. EST19A TaxID=2862681 RepID=UPI001CBD8024|nr:M23 family metallopeptidase [Microbacterium sp. EST19A]
MHASSRLLLGVLLAVTVALSTSDPIPASPAARSDDQPSWLWPVHGDREVLEPFRAPAHAFGAGHRGIDLAAPPDGVVRAPADGIVAFRGVVVDRPLLTIEHAGGLVTTFEPLESTLQPGDAVAAGDEVGVVATGGHATVGALHLGVRLDGEYINPMLLFGGVPRAVLLPCCAPL